MRDVRTWVFDLDDTLYDARPHVWPVMTRLMNGFIVENLGLTLEEAERQREYFRNTYGTTLRGLMMKHSIPAEAFVEYAHDFDITPVIPTPGVAEGLARLSGRKVVFTNSTRVWATRMIRHLGIDGHFDAIFAVEDGAYLSKPNPATYDMFIEKCGVDPKTACMIEDSPQNLKPAHDLGMRTVWLHRGDDADHLHVQHKAGTLPEWLTTIIEKG